MTLVEFLTARLDEDETEARLSKYDDWWMDGPFDPARVLREVEAKRAILADAERWAEAGWIKPGTTWNDDAAGAEAMTLVLARLAVVYVDHPDYDDAWHA